MTCLGRNLIREHRTGNQQADYPITPALQLIMFHLFLCSADINIVAPHIYQLQNIYFAIAIIYIYYDTLLPIINASLCTLGYPLMSAEESATSDEEDTYKEASPCQRWHKKNIRVNSFYSSIRLLLQYNYQNLSESGQAVAKHNYCVISVKMFITPAEQMWKIFSQSTSQSHIPE